MSSTLVGIRYAHHPESSPPYDRIVFDFHGPVPLIQIQYINTLIADGSGLPIPIMGNAILHMHFSPAHAHDDSGRATAPGRVAANLPIAKEIVRAGDFEAVVTYGIGLSKKAEIRILTLSDESRVVVDVF